MTDVLPHAVLERDRDAIRATLAAHGVTDAGVFGSVAWRVDTGVLTWTGSSPSARAPAATWCT